MNEPTEYEKELAQNNLQREAFIEKVLCELQTDLVVCKCMKDFNEEALPPLEEWKKYLQRFKEEIDRLYERVSIRENKPTNR